MKTQLDNALRFHQTALNVQARRQQLLASNIANADTPHYKARDIELGENSRVEDPGLTGVDTCDLGLSEASPLRGAARDGTDVGADLALLAPVFALGQPAP